MSSNDQQYDYELCADAVDRTAPLEQQKQQHRNAVLQKYAGLRLHIDSEQDLIDKPMHVRRSKLYRIKRNTNDSDIVRQRYLEKITLHNLFQHMNGAALLRFRNRNCFEYSVDLWIITQRHCTNVRTDALRCGYSESDLPKPLTIMTVLKYFCEVSGYYQSLDYVYKLRFDSKLDFDF